MTEEQLKEGKELKKTIEDKKSDLYYVNKSLLSKDYRAKLLIDEAGYPSERIINLSYVPEDIKKDFLTKVKFTLEAQIETLEEKFKNL